MKSRPSFHATHASPRALGLVAAAATCAFALSACIVVPLDTRTSSPAVHGEAQGPQTGLSPGYGAAAPALLPVPSSMPALPTQLAVRLYPLNAQANAGGMLQALVVDNNAGHGTFSVPYLGDTLQGEATRVDASYPAFGVVYQQVLGAPPRSIAGRRGIANAHGARGVNAQCEYVLTGPGAGTGVCRFSDGANYQMHFGV